jgi:hypothetical protein
MDWLSKILFPKHNPDLRRREMRWLTRVVLIALFLCVAFGVAVYFISRHR